MDTVFSGLNQLLGVAVITVMQRQRLGSIDAGDILHGKLQLVCILHLILHVIISRGPVCRGINDEHASAVPR